tara:strand:- start:1100 stop:2461 length:1362 start_codon:yes stop_codon:yes gene_type:complete
MKRANLIGCLMLSILLISPVTTWASSCPEGQKWNDRSGECVGARTGQGTKKSAPLKNISEIEFSITGHPIDFKSRRTQFIELTSKGDDKRDWYCRNIGGVVELSPTVLIDGDSRISSSNPTPMVFLSSDIFIESVYPLIESYVYGDDDAAKSLYEGLLEGARTDAYSVIEADPNAKTYGKWDEPTYYASMILWPLAYAYVLLVDEYGKDDPGVQEIKAWGDRLFVSSESKQITWTKGSTVKGADRAGLKAAAYSIWGNATGNEEALRKGYWYFRLAMRTVGSSGKDIYWKNYQNIRKHKKILKYVGMTRGPALYAAYALSLSGAENVFEEAPKGGNIKEGMAWLIKQAFETKHKIAYKTRSSSEGMGYAELFIRLFPDHPAAKMADTKLAIARHRSGIVTRHVGGGPATCLIRDIASPLWIVKQLRCKTTLGVIDVEEVGECTYHWLGELVTD